LEDLERLFRVSFWSTYKVLDSLLRVEYEGSVSEDAKSGG
jgi:hypothetical protein